jgi:hypothetical protein
MQQYKVWSANTSRAAHWAIVDEELRRGGFCEADGTVPASISHRFHRMVYAPVPMILFPRLVRDDGSALTISQLDERTHFRRQVREKIRVMLLRQARRESIV